VVEKSVVKTAANVVVIVAAMAKVKFAVKRPTLAANGVSVE
jgi:hypothetical protein